jgi:peptide/nickel transport system permease protein
MWPSLAVAVPVLLVGLLINISLALFLVLFRGGTLDLTGVVLLVAMLSISSLFYIIGGQYLLGKLLRLAPISGYDLGLEAWKFLVLPVIIGVMGGIGSGPGCTAPSFWKRRPRTMSARPAPRAWGSGWCFFAISSVTP